MKGHTYHPNCCLLSGLLLLPSNTQSTLLTNAGAAGSGVPTTVKKLNIARLVLVRSSSHVGLVPTTDFEKGE